MRITNMTRTVRGDWARLEATANFEDKDRASVPLFIEAPSTHAGAMTGGANAFLTGCIIAASDHGERRIRVDGAVCPQLADNLDVALRLLRRWYGDSIGLVEIDGPRLPGAKLPNVGAASFLSGGVDSLALLRLNHLTYPVGHPSRIRYCILAHGLNVGDPSKLPRPDIFDALVSGMREVTTDAGSELIPIRTNIRDLATDWRLYERKQYTSILSGLAHALDGMIDQCTIATDHSVEYQTEWASHPHLNANYSSGNLRISSGMEGFTRQTRTKLVADWPVALRNLRVCFMMDDIPPGGLNCGRCGKCILTMWQLLALGKLEEATSFPTCVLDPTAIDGLGCRTPYHLELWDSLAVSMERLGRADPARRFAALARKGRAFLSTRGERLITILRRLDDRALGGRVTNQLRHRDGEIALPRGVADRSRVQLKDPVRER